MGDVVNLNRARKAKARAAREAGAAANRAKFGRTRAERAAADGDAARRERSLDGARVEDAALAHNHASPPDDAVSD